MTLASQRKEIKWGNSAKEGKGNPNFSGGKYMDDKGYIRVLRPKHPYANKGYVYEHRLVMEKYLGRYLEPWETVHHINEVKIDNRVDNFFLTTPDEHSSIHREGKKKSHAQKNILRTTMKKASRKRKRTPDGTYAKNE
jgi:HNH endonuclease